MSFYEKEGFMATIYPNRKDGKIISVKLKAYLGRDENGKSVVYEGVSQIPSEGCTTLSYYIKDFVSLTKENTDGMKIWIRPHSDKDGGEYNMCISNVSFLSSSFSFKILLTVLLVLLVAGAFAFAVYFFVFKRPKKEPTVFRGFDRRKLKK